MLTLDKYQALKKKLDSHRRQSDQSRGVLDSLLLKLSKDFNCGTLEEGEFLLANLSLENQKAKELLEANIKEFQEEYRDKL